ncbi:MAG: type I methionyl aminopeptidase [Candidatus Orphnella occulta]|nr:type I methionyl aminopeptidase [Candidatus Orphnella occulta]MDP8296888.1 type I methionyl aminopeptidase [Candidatus Orphnella occulta]
MIELKSSDQIEKMRQASRILRDAIVAVKPSMKPGVSTNRLDDIVREKIIASGAKCAFLGYKGFPKTICASVNEEIVHGIPSDRVLREQDILSIDVGVEYEGYFSDAAITVAIGKISPEAARLIEITKEALYKAIDSANPGGRISDVSCAIQNHVEDKKLSIIRDYVGHGIGANLHEDPQIPNFGQPGMGVRLKKGMVLAIEPMVCIGGHEIEILEDGWTAVTKDRSFAAHFEHTVAITSDGPEILTDGIMQRE